MPGPYDKFQEAFEAFQTQLRQDIHEELAAFKQDLLAEVKQISGADDEKEERQQAQRKRIPSPPRKHAELSLAERLFGTEEERAEEEYATKKQKEFANQFLDEMFIKRSGDEEAALTVHPMQNLCQACKACFFRENDKFCSECGTPREEALEENSSNGFIPEQTADEDDTDFTF